MGISFTLDAREFTETLNKYADLVRNKKTRTEVVHEQLKFAVKAIIQLTPFETLAQGRQAVHTDLRKAVKPYGGENGQFERITSDGLRRRLVNYLRGQNYDAIRDIFSKLSGRGGFYAAYTMADFSPSLHHRAQNARGRVVSDHLVVVPQVSEWQDYLAYLQGRVGRARGGWAASASALGLSLPGWIMRWRAGGAYKETDENGVLTFTMTNRAVFMPDYRAKVETALAGRETAMVRDLWRMYNDAKTHAGMGR